MSDIVRHEVLPGPNCHESLRALGVSEEHARLWSRLGPRMRGTLRVKANVAIWEVHRELSAHLRIAGWSVIENGDYDSAAPLEPVLAELIDDVIAQLEETGFPLLKADANDGDSLFEELLDARGFTRLGDVGSPYPLENAPEETHSGWLLWNHTYADQMEGIIIPLYERQKTDFTCGAASALMTLGQTCSCADQSLVDEMALWRDATYSLGIGHFGLATVLAQRGASVKVMANHEGPIVGVSRTSFLGKNARTAVHAEHLKSANELGVNSQVRDMTVEDVTHALDEGCHVLPLVDLASLNGEDTPHWILIWGTLGDYLLIHDPWYDDEFGETWLETYAQAMRSSDLWAAAQWNDEGEHRVMLTVRTSR